MNTDVTILGKHMEYITDLQNELTKTSDATVELYPLAGTMQEMLTTTHDGREHGECAIGAR